MLGVGLCHLGRRRHPVLSPWHTGAASLPRAPFGAVCLEVHCTALQSVPLLVAAAAAAAAVPPGMARRLGSALLTVAREADPNTLERVQKTVDEAAAAEALEAERAELVELAEPAEPAQAAAAAV